MRKVNTDIERLNHKKRFDCNDIRIVEKVWIIDSDDLSTSYKGCFIKRWYESIPKLRLMTNEGIVESSTYDSRKGMKMR